MVQTTVGMLLAQSAMSAGRSLDAANPTAEVGTPMPTQSVPAFLRPGVRQAFVLALRVLREAYACATAWQQIRV